MAPFSSVQSTRRQENLEAAALNPQDRAGASEYVLTLLLLRRYAPLVEFADRYTAQFPDNRSIIRNASRARYELDGDRAAYLHRFTVMPLQAQDKFGLDAAADLALLRGDYARAEELFSDPRLEYLLSPGSVVRDPPALARAMVANLLGRPEDARARADEAIAYYERTKWTPHQRAAVLTTMAQAHAFAGRVEEMRRCATEARALLAGRDAFLEIDELPLLAQAYATFGLSEEAFALLREVMAGPARVIAQEIRHDPLWRSLRDDPRFEQILRSGKAL